MTADWSEDVVLGFGERILKRTYQEGHMRAVTLKPGPQRAAHVDPAAPRAVLRWTGGGWKLVAVVPSLAAAQAVMNPDPRGPGPW